MAGRILVELTSDELKETIESIEAKLRETVERRASVEKELRSFEKRYGIDSIELLRLIDAAEKGEAQWPFPDDADIDVIEWEALARLYMELVRKEARLRRLLGKLRRRA